MPTVTELKAELGAGAHASKYEVIINSPSANAALGLGEEGRILIKSATFPEVTIEPIEVFIQGRKLPLPGETSYGANTFETTYYTTTDHDVRTRIINWMTAIDNFRTNRHIENLEDYLVEAMIYQIDGAGNRTAGYKFYDFWPSTVGAMEAANENVNQILECPVTWTFSSFEPVEV